MIKVIEKPSEVADFAWELSSNDLFASYGRIKSYEALLDQLERAINLESRNIIAYYQGAQLIGVCFYYWISSEKYVQTTGFLIKENYSEVADEFISYIGNQLPGYELFIGMPFSNQQASEYFESKNIASVENSIVTRICKLAPHKSLGKDCLEKIKRSNFENYAPFHDKYAIPNEMYFNSKNLLAELDRFRIYVFKDAEEIRGSIFVSADKKLSDIYGLFMDEEYKRQGNEQILIHEMLAGLYSEFGTVEEILFFIDETSPYDLEVALEMGFEIKEKYRLYKCAL